MRERTITIIPTHIEMVTEERAEEVRELLARVRSWAARRHDIVAVGLAGSWAHGDARMDSDVDIILLTTEERDYLDGEKWVRDLGGLRIINTERWGPMTERRFVLPSGLEVEMGIAPPSWADIDPVDYGTQRGVEDGFSIIHDPEGLLIRLVEACS